MASSVAACSDAEKANWVLNAPRLPGSWRESVEFSGEESQKDSVMLHGSSKHFNQSTTTANASSEDKMLDLEKNSSSVDRSLWLLNGPEPPSLWHELRDSVRETIPCGNKCSSLSSQPMIKNVVSVIQEIFPILVWGRKYSISKFKHDLMAGLTIASLCIPQSIGYATLAKLDPQYGLYASVVPPLIYAIMGTSREIAIGPVAVVSLLLPSMLQKLQDPDADPVAYTKLVFTATFFTGIFQAAFGIFRLGFLVDLLSHAAMVGFMAGAAIIIGLQQLKGLLGIAHFPTSTDVISVMEAVWSSFDRHPWNPHNFMLGCSFLCFILISRFVGRKNRKFFWLPAIAPLISVILSTLIVYLTRADKHGIKILKHIKDGLNPSSVHLLQLNAPYVGDVAKVALIIAFVALTEAIAVGKSFSSMKGYHIDGNKEMMSMGFMNIVGSLTSCYVTTGSFSRTAVNFSSGCETQVSNIVMAITVIISLQFLTRLLYFTPTAILASIILSALPGLINVKEIYKIWTVDKLDFLACIGAFFGVLFVSVEIGLLIAVAISFIKIILISIRPGTETLGRLPGTDMFCDTEQYPMAVTVPGIMIVRVKSALFCFANANFIRDRIVRWITAKKAEDLKGNNTKDAIQVVILDMSNLINIDTSGIATLMDLQRDLLSEGIELAIANPRWQVIHKLKLSNFVGKMGGRVFVTVAEAVAATFTGKIATC